MIILNPLCLSLYFLECQPFVPIGQKDDAAILEPVFLQYVLQDMIVPVGICPQVGNLRVAPLQAGIGYSFAVFCTCQPVDDAVRERVLQPFSFIDMRICRVVSTDKGEGPDNFSGIVGAHVAVALFDVCHDDSPGRVTARPLQHIPVFPHDVFRLLEDIHKDFYLCGVRLSDFYHSSSILSVWLLSLVYVAKVTRFMVHCSCKRTNANRCCSFKKNLHIFVP